MSSHLTIQELQALRDRTIDPQRFLRADRHMSGCEYCQRKWRETNAAPAIPVLALELEEPLHLSFDALTAFLDGRQNPASRKRIETHLAFCPQCAREVQDLQKFDARMAEEARELTVKSSSKSSSGVSWRERVITLFGAPGSLRFGAASAAVAIIGLLAMIKVQVGSSDLQTRVVIPFAGSSAPQFYGGAILLALGVAGVLYRLFK